MWAQDMNVFIMPIDPRLQVTPTNAVAANLPARRYLTSLWTSTKDHAAYMRYASFMCCLDVGVAMVCCGVACDAL